MANSVLDVKTGTQMEFRHLVKEDPVKWNRSFANEFGRLAQGIGNRVQGTDTIEFTAHADVPKDAQVTYAQIVCDLRPLKDEVERTRLTVGGDKINYPYETSTQPSDLTKVKVLVNSTISTPKARFMTLDIIFFLEYSNEKR